MLTRIDLRYFKCFEILNLTFCPLTLLTGANASGKSTVMQALVLLHQTMREHERSSRLMLNGSMLKLGAVSDVINHEQGRRGCSISLHDNRTAFFHWDFEGEHSDLSMEVRRIHVGSDKDGEWEWNGTQPLRYLIPENFDGGSLPDRLQRTTYLTAERLGPREHYVLDDPQLTPVVGSKGENAVSVLYSGGDLHVLRKLVILDAPPTRFRQVEARMASFFPGCELEMMPVPRTNSVVLGIRTSRITDFHRPVHTGFGLTQVLPIVVSALSAKPDDLLLIENPEVHLHPAGQSAMGKFLAEVASSGVQVIVETHSDHVLNGIRRAVKQNTIDSNDIALHYFCSLHEEREKGRAQVESLAIDVNGNIDSWPDGFFDQFDKDLSYLAGWS